MSILKAIYKRFSIIKIFYFFLFLVLFISLIFSYNSDLMMFKVVDKLDELSKYQFRLKNYRTNLIKSFEQFKIPNYNSSFYKLPVYEIEFNQGNINFLNNLVESIKNTNQTYYKDDYILPEHPNDYNEISRINFYHNSEEYNAKVKIHGRSEEHYIDPKKSYAVRFNKNKLFENMREIAFIILDEADVTSLMSYMLLEKYSNLKIENGFARVKINGVDQGVYFFEEKIRKEVLEKNNLLGNDIIQPYASWTNQTNETHTHDFTFNIASTNLKNYSQLNNGQLLRYEKLVNSNKYQDLVNLVDIDKFAIFEAMRMLHADKHVVDGDNLKLIYDNATGIFSPFYRSESVIGSIEDFQSFKTLTYEKLSKDIPIFKVLTKNNEFRNLRNKFLYKMLNDKNNIFSFLEENFSLFKDFIKEDNSNLLSQRDYIYRIKSKIKIFKSNFEKLQKYIEYSKIYTQLIKINNKEYDLIISPDSNVKLAITSFKLLDSKNTEIPNDVLLNIIDFELNKEHLLTYGQFKKYIQTKEFILNLDENLENLKNEYKFNLSFQNDNDIQNLNVKFINSITNKQVNENNVFSRIIEMPNKFSYDYLDNKITLEKVKKIFGEDKITKKNNVIIIDEGNYYLNEDIIFPSNYKVVLKPGINIKLAPFTSMLIYGDFEARGTLKKPITITKWLDKNFSSVVVIGNGKTNVDINYLHISQGSEDFINGIYASGMLALHNHNEIKIANSIINSSSSDDGLNIKYINFFEIYNNVFKNNFADAVDIDIGNGTVYNNLFEANFETSSMGDGLDFSGSNSITFNNKFINFKDKGISVGEDSDILVSKNHFDNNRSSVTIKDSSSVILKENKYLSSNSFFIEMYVKKNIFNEPSLCVIKNDISIDNINKILNFNETNINSNQKNTKTDNFKIIFSNKDLEVNSKNLSILKEKMNENFNAFYNLYC